ncbi:hypothetical protein LZQ00_00395 [Sphingobacterium sp. SRCM116780]|uniref:hypothetical protein n=1 Tax=Sphingobacterium sp. SRCM116780 TaxID=2907623 RepID=UPI001F22B9C9|nr:hypothetical protein [Sphingobacterium sp. SRCM116780]UIR56301.1 hypothetical protein LZQ00_00395 [Sphingobacterium sp. SRCM116780]
MFKNILAVLCLGSLLISCNRTDESFYAQDPENFESSVKPLDSVAFDDVKDNVNIHINANANFSGLKDANFFLDIANDNHSYCHPDVLYFANGFHGFKYWMVFTPYFGAVGTTQNSKRYENPSIVVSNDGITWSTPPGLINPIMNAPYPQESLKENNQDPIQGFWSDVDWVYVNNKFYLYYRGSFISAQALKKRAEKNTSNLKKLETNAHRTIVQQTSVDGVNWSRIGIAFTSNPPFTPQNNHVLSPSFIHNGNEFISYEVELNLGKKNFKGKDGSYVIRRTSNDGLNFDYFKQSKIVHFANKPWLALNPAYSPWHIQASYVDGYYFLCLAIGDVKKYTSEALYIAYSKDGLHYKVCPKAILEHNAYRSAIFPMNSDEKIIHMGAMIATKSGEFRYKEFLLNKDKIDKSWK